MATFLVDVLLMGILVGVMGNAVFLFTLARLRPRLEISKQISRGWNKPGGVVRFRIKVINRSRWPITDIKAQLHLVRRLDEAGGQINRTTLIPLVQAEPMVIQKFSKHDQEADYAYRFAIEQPLDTLWKDDPNLFLRFRVVCRHSLSGFGGFFVQDFHVKSETIRDGSFAKGDSFEIIRSAA